MQRPEEPRSGTAFADADAGAGVLRLTTFFLSSHSVPLYPAQHFTWQPVHDPSELCFTAMATGLSPNPFLSMNAKTVAIGLSLSSSTNARPV